MIHSASLTINADSEDYIWFGLILKIGDKQTGGRTDMCQYNYYKFSDPPGLM